MPKNSPNKTLFTKSLTSRQYQVTVIRQDTSADLGGLAESGGAGRPTGFVVNIGGGATFEHHAPRVGSGIGECLGKDYQNLITKAAA